MIILLTNDDGFGSPGLLALKDQLKDHELWTVAPDGERSGTSHSITIKDPVRFNQIGEKEFTCSGTPADCVLFSILGALPVKPDFVVSGINMGPNLGTDIVYSGTAAAARQAAFMGVPACAVSINSFRKPFYFETAASFIRNNLDLFLELWSEDHFININVPNIVGKPEIAITHPSRRIYKDKTANFTSPGGQRYFFLMGDYIDAHLEEGSDWEAITENRISVSPIYLHPINQALGDKYHTAPFKKPG